MTRIGGHAGSIFTGDYDMGSSWTGNTILYEWRAIMGFPREWINHARGGSLRKHDYNALYSSSASKVIKLLRTIEQKNPDERILYVNQLLDIVGEEVYTISIGAPMPTPVLVSKEIRNVPKVACYDLELGGIGVAGTETYFFEHSNSSPALEQQLAESIIHPVLRPGAADIGASVYLRIINNILKYLVILLIVGALALLVLNILLRSNVCSSWSRP